MTLRTSVVRDKLVFDSSTTQANRSAFRGLDANCSLRALASPYPSSMSQLPIACSLTPDQLRCASEDLLPGLARRATRVDRTADAAELEFVVSDDLLAHIARVLDSERRCCQFLHFTLVVPPAGAPVHLTVRGPEGTGTFLESLHPAFAAPETHPSSRQSI